MFALAVGGLVRRHGAGAVLRWGLVAQSAGMLGAAVFLHEHHDLAAYAAAIVAARGDHDDASVAVGDDTGAWSTAPTS